jgi:hypothetical protein
MTMSRGPLARATAWRGVARCFVTSMALLGRGDIRWPRENVGRVVHFADGTAGRVYRETVLRGAPTDPCFLIVSFRLKVVRGRGHAWFRAESLLNTPLFVGFVSKLWLAHDRHGIYRGLYEWDGADRAERCVRSLWRVLELGCEQGSIDYRVFAGVRRDAVLATPRLLDGYAPDGKRGGASPGQPEASCGRALRGGGADWARHRPAGTRPRCDGESGRAEGGPVPPVAGDDRPSAHAREPAAAGRRRQLARARRPGPRRRSFTWDADRCRRSSVTWRCATARSHT